MILGAVLLKRLASLIVILCNGGRLRVGFTALVYLPGFRGLLSSTLYIIYPIYQKVFGCSFAQKACLLDGDLLSPESFAYWVHCTCISSWF